MFAKILFYIARIVAALIMFQTLFFKFSGAEESIQIFTILGEKSGIGFMEPYGRIFIGLLELAGSVMICLPKTVRFGSLLTMALMLGAIASHVVFLGIEVMGDGGQLFIYACVAFVGGLYAFIHDRSLKKSK